MLPVIRWKDMPPLHPAVKEVATISAPYDPAVKITRHILCHAGGDTKFSPQVGENN
jgi:hypothetical protein